jgi:hypothetical protein
MALDHVLYAVQRFRLDAVSRSYSCPPQTPPKVFCLLERPVTLIVNSQVSSRKCYSHGNPHSQLSTSDSKVLYCKHTLCLAEDEAAAGDVVVAAMAPTSNMMMKSSQSCPLRQSQNPCFRYTKTGRRCGLSSDISALGFSPHDSETSVPVRTCVSERISTLP